MTSKSFGALGWNILEAIWCLWLPIAWIVRMLQPALRRWTRASAR